MLLLLGEGGYGGVAAFIAICAVLWCLFVAASSFVAGLLFEMLKFDNNSTHTHTEQPAHRPHTHEHARTHTHARASRQ